MSMKFSQCLSQGWEVKEDEILNTRVKFHTRSWLLRTFSYAHAIF